MRIPICILTMLTLTACPDPVTAVEDNSTTASQEQMAGSGPSSMETGPDSAKMKVNPGEGVMVTGSFNYSGAATGQKKIDTLKPQDGRGPSLVHVEELQGGNDFKIEFPKNYGKVMLKGIIDKTGNGPSSDDPQGVVTLMIEETPIENIKIDVSDDFKSPQAPSPNQQAPGAASGEQKENAVAPAPEGGTDGGKAPVTPTPSQAPAASDGGPPSDD